MNSNYSMSKLNIHVEQEPSCDFQSPSSQHKMILFSAFFERMIKDPLLISQSACFLEYHQMAEPKIVQVHFNHHLMKDQVF
jgi:hypothetical protein